MSKLNVAIIFGGATMRDTSIAAAINIIDSLSREKYNILPVYVNDLGNYFLYEGKPHAIKAAEWENFGTRCQISLERQDSGLIRISGDRIRNVPVDIAIPLLRCGLSGGQIQGTLEMGGIKYIGAGVLASAFSADNAMIKTIAKSLGISYPKHLVFDSIELDDFDALLRAIRYKIGYPCHVKPLTKGDFDGISYVRNKKELEGAILAAFLHERRITVEKEVVGRKFVCAVYESSDGVRVLGVAEKLLDGGLCLSPKLDAKIIAKIERGSLDLFKSMNASGLVSFTFCLEEKVSDVVLHDLNTILEFADSDDLMKLVRGAGMDFGEFLDMLIEYVVR